MAGSTLILRTAANLNLFVPSLQLTQNPTVVSTILIAPQYEPSPAWRFRARVGIDYEWTNDDATLHPHQAVVSDALLDAVYRGIPDLLGGIQLKVGVLVALPLSQISQARTMLFAPGALADLGHVFDGVLDGKVTIDAIGAYQHPFYRYTTAQLETPPAYAAQCFGGGASCIDQASGAANVRDVLAWTLLLGGEWGRVNPGLLFRMSHEFTYRFQALPGVAPGVDPPGVRMSTLASAFVDVRLVTWLSAEVGYAMARNLIDGDGKYGNPFFDRYQDMRLYLGANLSLEAFRR